MVITGEYVHYPVRRGIFDRDHVTGEYPEPDNVEDNEELCKILLCSALDMKKLFPMRWTKEVHNKFVDIGIHTPQELLHLFFVF